MKQQLRIFFSPFSFSVNPANSLSRTQAKNARMIRRLLFHHGADLQSVDANGSSILHRCAREEKANFIHTMAYYFKVGTNALLGERGCERSYFRNRMN